MLKGTAIAFRSTSVARSGDSVDVAGELELAGRRRPLAFSLTKRSGAVTGSARIRQTDWGMKPYSALFGTLKVADEVEVAIESRSEMHG
jgi:polyisoprenoid-binding protein YceI